MSEIFDDFTVKKHDLERHFIYIEQQVPNSTLFPSNFRRNFARVFAPKLRPDAWMFDGRPILNWTLFALFWETFRQENGFSGSTIK